MRRLRRGLTVLERDKMRAEVYKLQVDLAVRRAREYGLSLPCRAAMEQMNADPDQARELHRTCKGEEIGGTGCLCVCHDVRDTATVSGCSG